MEKTLEEIKAEQFIKAKKDIPAKKRMYKDDSLCSHCGYCLSVFPSGVLVKTEHWEIKSQPERFYGCSLFLYACPAG